PPLVYRWRFNGANISGATNSALAFPAVSLANQGSYSVVVSNFSGAVTSAVAQLVVSVPVLVLNDASGPESSSLDFRLDIQPTSSLPITVSFGTVDGSARSGSDFIPTNGLLLIPPGTNQAGLRVAVIDDLLAEPN